MKHVTSYRHTGHLVYWKRISRFSESSLTSKNVDGDDYYYFIRFITNGFIRCYFRLLFSFSRVLVSNFHKECFSCEKPFQP